MQDIDLNGVFLHCGITTVFHTSSLAMRMSSLTLEKTVGSMKNPFKPRAFPPHSSLAPSLMPLWTNSKIRFCCSRLICGGGGKTLYERPGQGREIQTGRGIQKKREQNFCSNESSAVDASTSPVDPAQ